MLSTLGGVGYFFKSEQSLTRKCAGNYAIHAGRDWLFFFKSKPGFTRKYAGNYAVNAGRDWLFF